ncbi:MAG: N-acetyl-gamma-glutamyl-phosphate reductase [Candidatus Carbobacillus altaicus]|nr:N-acetyl-gamma-glutamyl-phosphate reductase [Candidatus Carbobacillus altaicus]
MEAYGKSLNLRSIRVAVIGTGYGGVELIRLLTLHPGVSTVDVYSYSKGGESLPSVYSHLYGVMEKNVEMYAPAHFDERYDLVFLATPHGVSKTIAAELFPKGFTIIDLSGDFRLKRGHVYEAWYGKQAAPSDLLEEAVYGLPEFKREAIKGARLIANPGCYATAAILGAAPLLLSRLIHPEGLIFDGKSGVSGAGRTPALGVHFSEVNESVSAYKVARHQHTPEIEQMLSAVSGEPVTIVFTPHLVPMTRGILMTIYGRLKKDVTDEDMEMAYTAAYREAPFVRLRRAGDHPTTKNTSGTNWADIAYSLDRRTGTVVVTVALDNLLKGAAGQAVQNMNVRMGWDESLGLPRWPVYP